MHTTDSASSACRSAGGSQQKRAFESTRRLPAVPQVNRGHGPQYCESCHLVSKFPDFQVSEFPSFPSLQVSEFPELVVLGVALEGFQGSFHRWLTRLEPELATDSDDRCKTSRRKVARGARPRKVSRTARPRTARDYFATSGMIACLPGTIFCKVPRMVWRIRSGKNAWLNCR